MEMAFNTIGLIGKYNAPEVGATLLELADYLTARDRRVLIDQGTSHLLGNTALQAACRDTLGKECDLVIVVGGDGTLLNAARSLNDYNVPLLGVNLGRLGFLVDVHRDKMLEAIEEILNGVYTEEHRFLLHTWIERQGEIINESNAFNDVAIHKSHVARMIELECYVDQSFVSTMRADGLVISTPTGSTAYALSAGGPVLHPALNAITLVPICAHTLSNRPIVVGGDSEILIHVRENAPSEVLVSCDGQIGLNLLIGDTLIIKKKANPVRLLHPANYDYFEILRVKLHWGEKLTS